MTLRSFLKFFFKKLPNEYLELGFSLMGRMDKMNERL